MKTKTLVAMAALALLVGVPARAQQVVSSNTVGYMKLTLQPGYNMIANNFVTVGEEELFKISEMFQDDENATANMDSSSADRIDTWDVASQQYVSYYRMTNRRQTDFWWGKEGAATETTDSFENIGDGAFYYNQKTEGTLTLTLSGQVKSSNTEITISPGFNLICNPYPSDLAFTELDWSDAVANMDSTSADRIDTWDAASQQYVSYYYLTNRRQTEFWWGKEGSTTPTEDPIPAGQAFFYYSQKQSDWTLTLVSPVSASASGN